MDDKMLCNQKYDTKVEIIAKNDNLTCFLDTLWSIGSVYSKLSALATLNVFPPCEYAFPMLAGSAM